MAGGQIVKAIEHPVNFQKQNTANNRDHPPHPPPVDNRDPPNMDGGRGGAQRESCPGAQRNYATPLAPDVFEHRQ